MTTKTTPRRFDARHTFQLVRRDGTEGSATYTQARTWTDMRIGQDNPRHKIQIKSGVQAATPLYGERVQISSLPGFAAQFSNLKAGQSPSSSDIMVKQNAGSSIPANIPASPGSLSESLANNLALERIVNKIRSKQTTFESGVFAGELIQSLKLITNPAREIRKRVDRYRDDIYRLRRDIRNFSRNRGEVVKRARDTWLTYQLGWAPLVGEVDSAMQAFAESNVLTNGTWDIVRAIGVDEKITSRSIAPNWTANAPYYNQEAISKDVVTVRYIASVDVGSYSAANSQRMGMAPTNWLPTVWELIPYSFVIDYFTNIGNIVEAATLARSSVRWIVKTVRREKRVDFINPVLQLNPPTSKFSYSGWGSPGKRSISRRIVERIPFEGSLVPDFRFKLPGFKTQWTNVAALIHAKNELRSYYR